MSGSTDDSFHFTAPQQMVYKIFTTRWEYALVGDPHKMAIVISKMWITMGGTHQILGL